MITDEIKYVLQHLTHRKLRTFLSVLSIFIGITSIFALLSFGIGIQKYVDDLAQQSGTDKMIITGKGFSAPGTDTSFSFTKSDVDFIGKINGVEEVIAMYVKPVEIKYKKENSYNYLIGLDPENIDLFEEMGGIKIFKGRDLKKDDSKKVVLGYNYLLDKKIFDRGLIVGDYVLLNGEQYQVVGFYGEIGNPQDDSQIYLTNDQIEELYPEIKDNYGYGIIRASPDVKTSELAEIIKERLRKHNGEEKGKETFFIQTFEDALKTFTNIIVIINGVLVLIAIVSMIVAFVNIMNTMYTAVLERTKEIGVMKAIGARNNFIMFVFVLESGMIGLVGGIAGIFGGFIVAKLGESAAARAGFALLEPSFPLWLSLGCLLFAFSVGIASGYLPAKQASKLKPVDALRYE